VAAHGELSLSQDPKPAAVPPFPYDSPTVNIIEIPADGTILNIYYHVDVDEQPHIFPLDPRLEYLTVTTSDSQLPVSLRQADFKDMISKRDGDICVATGQERSFCKVAHLIEVSKGDNVCAVHFVQTTC